MNKQRKVLITITYNEMGIIIDTKAEEVAQPDLDEWCTDCKEYDQERHSCPRWTRVIRQTLKDAQPDIIRCKDCRKWHTNCLAVCGKHGCDVVSDYTKPDDYCSWAERREG